jgi:hydrogenase nickel incorporation protein HypB
MCVTCGCSDDAEVTMTNVQTGAVSTLTQEHTHVLSDGTVVTHSHHHTHAHNGEGQAHSHDHNHAHPADPHLHPHSHSHDHRQTHGVGGDRHPPTSDHNHSHNSSHSHSHNTITPGESNGASVAHAASATIHASLHGTVLTLEQNLLAKNDLIAAQNRGWLRGRNTLALNLVSSPGSGKTTLLTCTIHDLKHQIPFSVIEGDQATANDADRIKQTGCPVVQINTGTGCHLEAAMVERGLQELNPPLNSIVMIENVGNLVCPALFDLGEQAKVVILSVTEGEDKPIKYPHMFRASSVMVLTKVDLLPYVSFSVDRCLDYARQVNPDIRIFQVSSTQGTGLSEWYEWLAQAVAVKSLR